MIYVFEDYKFLFVFSTCFKSNLQKISLILVCNKMKKMSLLFQTFTNFWIPHKSAIFNGYCVIWNEMFFLKSSWIRGKQVNHSIYNKLILYFQQKKTFVIKITSIKIMWYTIQIYIIIVQEFIEPLQWHKSFDCLRHHPWRHVYSKAQNIQQRNCNKGHFWREEVGVDRIHVHTECQHWDLKLRKQKFNLSKSKMNL